MSAFNKATTNIRRTPYQAAAALLVLTITFFVAIVVSFVTIGFYQALKYFETRPQVLIFFDAEASQENIDTLKTQLDNNPLVSDLVYVPKEEALNIYQELNKDDPLLLELVTADILPASLEVSTHDLESLKEISNQIQGAQGVDEVSLRTDLVDTLNQWLTGIRLIWLSFIGIMALTSILILIIVVGMKISGKHYEITILQLIGASHWYIQGPFLLEGLIYGTLSALIAYVLSVILLLYSTPFVLAFSGEVPLLPTSPLILSSILAVSLLSGGLIGTFGSWIALKRFLKL